MAFATEQAMRDYVTGLGDSFFLGDPELIETEFGNTQLPRQRLVEFHGNVAVPKTYDFYKAQNGSCWFKDQLYSRSAVRVRPNFHAEP